MSVIARAYRRKSKYWDDAIREEIVEWVERCEEEELTVEQLRTALASPLANGKTSSGCHVEHLQQLIDAGWGEPGTDVTMTAGMVEG